MRRFSHLGWAAALWLLLGPAARAERPDAVPTPDAGAIRRVIEAQIEAFARDDGEAAFALASPAIQSIFESPERFLDMVRTGYAVVYRPASVLFLPVRMVHGEAVQAVQMSDGRGGVWVAVYRMQRHEGAWRIDGCVLVPADATGT
jgi:hypothetical protein